jgi:hypothetical protein
MMAREFRVLRAQRALHVRARGLAAAAVRVRLRLRVPQDRGRLHAGRRRRGCKIKFIVRNGRCRFSPVNLATILVPGLMASMLLMQGIFGVTLPLVMEFSWQRTIEDRALAPVPIRVLAVQKITAGRSSRSSARASSFPSCCWCTPRARHRTCTSRTGSCSR